MPRSRSDTPSGSSPADLLGDRFRQQHLTAVSSAHDACRAIDRAAIEVAVAPFVDSRMQSAAQRQRQAVRCIRRRKLLLDLESGDQRIERAVKRGVHAVAGHLHDRSAVAFDRCFGDGIVTRHHRRHPLGLLLPEPGAALDIREKKCDGSLFRHAVQVSSEAGTDVTAAPTCRAHCPVCVSWLTLEALTRQN